MEVNERLSKLKVVWMKARIVWRKEMFTPNEKGSGSAMLHVAPWLLLTLRGWVYRRGGRVQGSLWRRPGPRACCSSWPSWSPGYTPGPTPSTGNCHRSMGFHNHGEGPFYYYSAFTFKTLFYINRCLKMVSRREIRMPAHLSQGTGGFKFFCWHPNFMGNEKK